MCTGTLGNWLLWVEGSGFPARWVGVLPYKACIATNNSIGTYTGQLHPLVHSLHRQINLATVTIHEAFVAMCM